jgi:hypothetical protein
MGKRTITSILALIILISSCSMEESKIDKINKNEIAQALIGANAWFKEKRHRYIFEYTKEEASDWNKTIQLWINESNYFSKYFIEGLKPAIDNDNHFGLYFYSYQDLGKMLKALCQDNENDIYKGIEKISDGKYRYITYFSTVLNSLPDPNYDEKYLWLWETYDDGSRWYFSLIIIKENDKWVIDKIERYKTVLEENTN